MVDAGLCGVQMMTALVRGVTRRAHVVEVRSRSRRAGSRTTVGARQRRLGAVGLEGRVRDHDLVAGLERRARQQREELVGAVADARCQLGRHAEPLAERLPHLRASRRPGRDGRAGPRAGSPRPPAARGRGGSRWRTGAGSASEPELRASASSDLPASYGVDAVEDGTPEPSHRAPIVATIVTAIQVRATFDSFWPTATLTFRHVCGTASPGPPRRGAGGAGIRRQRGRARGAPAPAAARAAPPAPHLQRGLPPRGPPGRRLRPAVGARPTPAFMDSFLAHALPPGGGGRQARGRWRRRPLVLVALGGYGRGELHPLSDLDLMVIYDGEMGPYVQRVTQGLLYTLWDLGLAGRPRGAQPARLRGHGAHRLPEPHLDAAGALPRRATGGSSIASGRCCAENVYRKDFAQFLETTLAERDQRYRKFGGSPYMGEPNVKESAGGLRDIHTAMWLASTKFGTRTLRELADKRLITDARADGDRRGADLPVARAQRAALPLRAQERRALARRPAADRQELRLRRATSMSLGVEKFMRDYYLHARVIHRVSRRLIARCRETLSRRGTVQRRLRQEALADGLFVHRRAAPPRPPRRARLPRRADAAHEGVLALPPARLRARRRTSSAPSRTRSTWSTTASGARRRCAISSSTSAGAGDASAQTLREMHELGVLGRYLPEWGALTCLVQYDVYHKFTADQHSLHRRGEPGGARPRPVARSPRAPRRC